MMTPTDDLVTTLRRLATDVERLRLALRLAGFATLADPGKDWNVGAWEYWEKPLDGREPLYLVLPRRSSLVELGTYIDKTWGCLLGLEVSDATD